MAGSYPYDDIGRQHPARGVHLYPCQPTIVLLATCTEDRKPWLSDSVIHQHLRAAWRSAETWLVGYYLLMPDHLHLFCAPQNPNVSLEKWATYWKRQFRRFHQDPHCRWQPNSFHHRLRRQENYTEKWNYVRENPVRKGLVKTPEDWPYQGMINNLRW
jgi:putative transposase